MQDIRYIVRANGLWDNQFAEICVKGQSMAMVRMSEWIQTLLGSYDPFTILSIKAWTASWTTMRKMLKSREATRPGLEKMASGEFSKTAEWKKRNHAIK